MKDNWRKNNFKLVCCVCVCVNNKAINPQHFWASVESFCAFQIPFFIIVLIISFMPLSRTFYCFFVWYESSSALASHEKEKKANLITIVINVVKFFKTSSSTKEVYGAWCMRLCITFTRQLMFNMLLMNKMWDFKWLANESSGSDDDAIRSIR